MLIVESLFLFIKTNNFNGDTLPRLKFHGAYSISNPNLDLINVFVHRQGYLIFKNKKEEFQDFQLEVDSINSKFLLFDYENNKKYELIYTETNNQLKTLEGNINGNSIKFALDKIDWQSSPLFTDKFQWTTNLIYGI